MHEFEQEFTIQNKVDIIQTIIIPNTIIFIIIKLVIITVSVVSNESKQNMKYQVLMWHRFYI